MVTEHGTCVDRQYPYGTHKFIMLLFPLCEVFDIYRNDARSLKFVLLTNNSPMLNAVFASPKYACFWLFPEKLIKQQLEDTVYALHLTVILI